MKKIALILMAILLCISCYPQKHKSKYIDDDIYRELEYNTFSEYFKFRAEYNPLVNPDSLREYHGGKERGMFWYKSGTFIFDLSPYMNPNDIEAVSYNKIPLNITNYPDSFIKTGYYLIHKPKNILYNVAYKYYVNIPFFFDSLYKFDDYILAYCEELGDFKYNIKMLSGNVELYKNPYPKNGAKENLLKFFSEEFLQVRLRGVRFGLHRNTKILGGNIFKDSLDNFEKKRIAYTVDHSLIKTDSLINKTKSGLLFFTYDTLYDKNDRGYDKMNAFFFTSDKQFTNDENGNNIYMIKYNLIYTMQYDKIYNFPKKNYDDVKPKRILIANNMKDYQSFLKTYFVSEVFNKERIGLRQNFLEFNVKEIYKGLKSKTNYLKDRGASFLVGKSVHKH